MVKKEQLASALVQISKKKQNILAKNVVSWRVEKNITQQQLATHLGISQAAVCRLEKVDALLSSKARILQIVRLFNVSEEKLLTEYIFNYNKSPVDDAQAFLESKIFLEKASIQQLINQLKNKGLDVHLTLSAKKLLKK